MRIGIVKKPEEALIVEVGEGRLKDQDSVDGSDFFEEGDDVFDESHLVGAEVAALHKDGKSFVGGFDVEAGIGKLSVDG